MDRGCVHRTDTTTDDVIGDGTYFDQLIVANNSQPTQLLVASSVE